jgi:hypothetical protein
LKFNITITDHFKTFCRSYLFSPLGALLGAKAIAAATIARNATIWNDFMVVSNNCNYKLKYLVTERT